MIALTKSFRSIPVARFSAAKRSVATNFSLRISKMIDISYDRHSLYLHGEIMYRSLSMAVEVKSMDMKQFSDILTSDQRKVQGPKLYYTHEFQNSISYFLMAILFLIVRTIKSLMWESQVSFWLPP